MEIVKFGGSSMATPTTIKLCRDIVTKNSEPQIIVVSAPGKYGIYQTKITDDLIRYTKGAPILNDILQRFKDLGRELLNSKQYQLFIKIINQTHNKIIESMNDYNFIVSRGEYLSAQLFALYLGYRFIDAYDILIINPDATINLAATKQQIKLHHLKSQIPFVIGGFYGQHNGETALFTRGGSDYTGAILAVLMHATIYKNYTDTNGIQTANPRLVPDTRTISCLDFDALDILTHNGAGIIHENVAKLLKTYRVPLRVDNTFNPNQNFTEVHSLRCRNCQQNYFCVTNQNNHILLVKKMHGKPITTQFFESTSQTLINDMQRLHQETMKQL